MGFNVRTWLARASAFAGVILIAVGLIALAFNAEPLSLVVSAAAYAADVSSAVSASDPVSEPDGYRMDDYRSPVPATLKGATVLSNADAERLWAEKRAVFIDVYPHAPKPANLPEGTLWRETTHQSIEDAVWLPNVGYGVLSAATDGYFRRSLEALTGGDKTKPLVFFCLRNCWMSWNAAKRALSYGYKHVNWYPEGSDGWQEIGGLVVEARPLQ